MNVFFYRTDRIVCRSRCCCPLPGVAAAEEDTAKNLSTATGGSGKAQLKAIDHLGELHEAARRLCRRCTKID